MSGDVKQWQGEVEARDGRPELGPAAHLFEASTAVFAAGLQVMIGDDHSFDPDSYRSLRNEFRRFYLWNEGFSTSSGGLDRILSSSKNLEATVLSLMVSWTKAVLRIPKAMPASNWTAVQREFAELEELTGKVDQIARAALQDRELRLPFAYGLRTEGSSDTNSDGESSPDDDPVEEVVEDLNAYMENLIDLSPSLDYPAIDTVLIEDPATNLNDILSGATEPAHPFVLAIRDRFPSMEKGLIRRLGEANWDRRQRLREKLSTALELRANPATNNDELDIEDTDDTVVGDSERRMTGYEASAVGSSFSHPSNYQSSTTRSGFSEPSIFDRGSISISHGRRGSIAESMTSFASSAMDGSGPGQRRVPNLPDNYDFESPFECPICGDILTQLRHRADWKKHVFNDLEPYICLVTGCKLGVCTFKSRTEWMQHEFQAHRIGTEWRCTFCKVTSDSQEAFRKHLGLAHTREVASAQIEELISASKRIVPCDAAKEMCPFCISAPAKTREGFARHVGKHQQDISLAALPNLDTSSDDGSSNGDSGNDNDGNGDDYEDEDSINNRGDDEDGSGNRGFDAKNNDNDETRSLQSDESSRTPTNQAIEKGSTEVLSGTSDGKFGTDDTHSEEKDETNAAKVGQTSEGPGMQAHLEHRAAIIKELLDSELVFLRDMKVIEEIYIGTAEACHELESGDINVIFRNIDKIVGFSAMFLDELRSAGASVYSPVHRSSRTTVGATTVEGDRKTYLGTVFGRHIQRMNTIYTDFLKRGEQGIARLTKLRTKPVVLVWLSECDLVSKDLTHQPNLEALLMRPMQRIIAYRLFLGRLLVDISEDHPDFQPLQNSYDGIGAIILHIDDEKSRIGTIDKILTRKDPQLSLRSELTKAFRRNAGPAVPNVLLSRELSPELEDSCVDERLRLQVVIRDFQQYTRDIRTWTDDFCKRFLSTMELVMRISASPYPEIESRWVRLNCGMQDMGSILEDHISAVEKKVIDPLEEALRLRDSLGSALNTLKRRRPDYEKYTVLKVSNKKIDAMLMERANEYTALSETLNLELPKLKSLTSKLGNECLARFIAIQRDWWNTWTQRLKAYLTSERLEIPKDMIYNIKEFSSDYKVALGLIEELSIVSGSLLEDGSQKPLSPASSTRRPETLSSGRLSSGRPSPSTIPHKSWESEKEMKGRSSLPNPDFSPQLSGRPFPGIFNSALPLPNQEGGLEDLEPSRESIERGQFERDRYNVLYIAASLFEFNIETTKTEAGYPWLTYQAGEIFNVIAEKGELWLALNQDDPSGTIGWVWNNHFARMAAADGTDDEQSRVSTKA